MKKEKYPILEFDSTKKAIIEPSDQVLKPFNSIKDVLEKNNIKYIVGKTWTTSSFYRETVEKVRLRKTEGCLTVEMESSAFFSIAQFRGVEFAQILYGGDDVSGEVWDSRKWDEMTTIREKIFWLAVEACLNI